MAISYNRICSTSRKLVCCNCHIWCFVQSYISCVDKIISTLLILANILNRVYNIYIYIGLYEIIRATEWRLCFVKLIFYNTYIQLLILCSILRVKVSLFIVGEGTSNHFITQPHTYHKRVYSISRSIIILLVTPCCI